jgi:hypothetical protein
MAKYKATFIFEFHENESHSAVFDKIKQLYQALGVPNPQTRRAMQYYPLEDIQDDVGRRIVDGTNYDITDRATTYHIISWEKLTDD